MLHKLHIKNIKQNIFKLFILRKSVSRSKINICITLKYNNDNVDRIIFQAQIVTI